MSLYIPSNQLKLPADLSVEEYLRDLDYRIGILMQALRFETPDEDDYLLLTYPLSGGLRNMPAGNTTFDLRQGTVQRPDGVPEQLSNALDPRGLKACHSAFIYVDTLATLQASYGGQTTGQFRIDGGNRQTLRYQIFDKLVIAASQPYECFAVFSTLNQPPLDMSALVGQQDRYNGAYTTVNGIANAFTDIPLAPADGGAALGAGFFTPLIYTGAVGSKVFMVVNNGANSADINMRLQEVTGGNFVDSSITGASTTLGSGNSAIFEEGLYAQYTKLRARPTTTGLQTTLQVQYRGFSQTR